MASLFLKLCAFFSEPDTAASPPRRLPRPLSLFAGEKYLRYSADDIPAARPLPALAAQEHLHVQQQQGSVLL